MGRCVGTFLKMFSSNNKFINSLIYGQHDGQATLLIPPQDKWPQMELDAKAALVIPTVPNKDALISMESVITYATLAPSDMPLYTHMETSSIAASLSDDMSWKLSTETGSQARLSTVSVERRVDSNTASQSVYLSVPSPSRQIYPWSTRRLIPKPGIVHPTALSLSPFPRYGHAMPATCTAAGEFLLFGGLMHAIATNDLYLFSTRDMSIKLLQTGGEIPSPRVGHASALVNNLLIVMGGDTKTDSKSKLTDKLDDGLYMLNLGVYLILFAH